MLRNYWNGTQIKRCIKRENKVARDEQGDPILRSEFDKLLEEVEAEKAVGVGKIACKLLKYGGEMTLKSLYELTGGRRGAKSLELRRLRVNKFVIPKDYE